MSKITDETNEPPAGGVVLSNPRLPSLGHLVNFAIYDGVVEYQTLLDQVATNAEERTSWRTVLPTPRCGGGAFSHAVRALQTKRVMAVHENPDKVLSGNPEGLRLSSGGAYGFHVQWNIIALRRNHEYALRRTCRGFLDGQPREQVREETLYRVRINYPTKKFPRQWGDSFMESVWGTGSVDVEALRRCVIVEPMQEGSLPHSARFMRTAQERLREAFVQACTCVDDDRLRMVVRNHVKGAGGILSNGSSGGSYFVYDPDKTRLNSLENVATLVETFDTLTRESNSEAYWTDQVRPWWHTTEIDSLELWELIPEARRVSSVNILGYGSSEAQLQDIRNSFTATLQQVQATYYRKVREMIEHNDVDLDELRTLRQEVTSEFQRAKDVVGEETVKAALSNYSEYVPHLVDRLSVVMSPEDRERESALGDAQELLGFDSMLSRI